MPGPEEGWHRQDNAGNTIPDVGQETKGFNFDPGMTGLAEEGSNITSTKRTPPEGMPDPMKNI